MRARKEYTEYSREEISDDYAQLAVSGRVDSFTWEKKPSDYFQGEPIYDPPIYILTLRLTPYSTGTFTYESFRGSLPAHTRFLERKIAQWVKFYMGKGRKPKSIGH